jgi:predicted histidine transporter YuiF (NhaC family)
LILVSTVKRTGGLGAHNPKDSILVQNVEGISMQIDTTYMIAMLPIVATLVLGGLVGLILEIILMYHRRQYKKLKKQHDKLMKELDEKN